VRCTRCARRSRWRSPDRGAPSNFCEKACPQS
jgi:hypothetical protein